MTMNEMEMTASEVWANFAMIRPKVTAMAVVPKYVPKVRTPKLPSRFGSPIAMMPETSVKKTKGTINIRIKRKKRSPIQAI